MQNNSMFKVSSEFKFRELSWHINHLKRAKEEIIQGNKSSVLKIQHLEIPLSNVDQDLTIKFIDVVFTRIQYRPKIENFLYLVFTRIQYRPKIENFLYPTS